MKPSRIIAKDQAERANRFDFPSVDPTAADALRGAAKGSAHQLTAGQLDELQKQAREEAAKRGFDEGLAAGKAEIASRVARLESIAAAFSQPFRALEQAVEEEIVSLAVTLASHLVRREIERDPAVLHAAVHDCMAVLSANVRDVTLYLNPQDAPLVREHLGGGAAPTFKIAVEPELARGDMRIASSSSLVDGSIEARCAEILAAARATSTEGE